MGKRQNKMCGEAGALSSHKLRLRPHTRASMVASGPLLTLDGLGGAARVPEMGIACNGGTSKDLGRVGEK
jgi:hypothetical protein